MGEWVVTLIVTHAKRDANPGASPTFGTRRVDEKGTPILLKHRMTKIYREPNGPVVGIEVDNEDRLLNIKSRKAVIVATGGYTDNESMCAAWDPRVVGPETYGDGGIPQSYRTSGANEGGRGNPAPFQLACNDG